MVTFMMLVLISLQYTLMLKNNKKKSTQTKKSPVKTKEHSTYCINSITYRSKLKILEHTSSTRPGALQKQVTSRSKSNLILEFTAFLRHLLTASPGSSHHPCPLPRTPFQPSLGPSVPGWRWTGKVLPIPPPPGPNQGGPALPTP